MPTETVSASVLSVFNAARTRSAASERAVLVGVLEHGDREDVAEPARGIRLPQRGAQHVAQHLHAVVDRGAAGAVRSRSSSIASTDSGVILRRDAATFCCSTTATNRSRSSPDGTSKTSSASSSGSVDPARRRAPARPAGVLLEVGELLGLVREEPGQRVELALEPLALRGAGRDPGRAASGDRRASGERDDGRRRRRGHRRPRRRSRRCPRQLPHARGSGAVAEAVAAAVLDPEVGEVGDDRRDAEVLRRVDARDARPASSRSRSASGMMPPTTTGASTPFSRRQPDGLGNELEVRAGEDREADDVDVLVACRGRDLLGREPDALVDDFEAGVARRDARSARRRWSDRRVRACRRAGGSVRRARGPRPGCARAPRPARRRARPRPIRHRWARGTRRTPRAARRPIRRRSRRRGRGRSSRGRGSRGVAAAVAELRRARSPPRSASRSRAPLRSRCSTCSCSAAGSTTRMCSASSVTRGESALSVKQLTPTTGISPVSIRRTRSAWLWTSRPFMASIISKAPPPSSTQASSAAAASPARPSWPPRPSSPRRGPRTRADRSRRPAPAGSAATTAGPTAGAARAPRSTRAAARRGRGASRDRVTPSISSTIRCTLFSGCASVSPSELTCTP